mgnify:FL=1
MDTDYPLQPGEPIPERLTELSQRRREGYGQRRNGRFVRGPIPLRWLKTAAALPGKALQVGIALWFKWGVVGQAGTIAVTDSLVSEIDPMDRKTRYRALKSLEEAQLVAVTRRPGMAPRAAIILKPEEPD